MSAVPAAGSSNPADPDVKANRSLPNQVPTPGTPPAFTTVDPGCGALIQSLLATS